MNRALSDFQRTMLSAALAAGGSVAHAVVFDRYFGSNGASRNHASEKAALARSKKQLVTAGLLKLDKHLIVLSESGRDAAGGLTSAKSMLAPKQLEPIVTRVARPRVVRPPSVVTRRTVAEVPPATIPYRSALTRQIKRQRAGTVS
jgi:hypothetical protein